jgi:hypothetical protein
MNRFKKTKGQMLKCDSDSGIITALSRIVVVFSLFLTCRVKRSQQRATWFVG